MTRLTSYNEQIFSHHTKHRFRAGYDGAKRKKGSKVHIAVDTLGHLLAVHVTPANEQERAQVAELVAQVQEVTEHSVTVAYVYQGYTGEVPAAAAKDGRGACGSRRRRGRDPGSRQTARSQERFCAAAAPLRGGAHFCVVSPLPPGQRL